MKKKPAILIGKVSTRCHTDRKSGRDKRVANSKGEREISDTLKRRVHERCPSNTPGLRESEDNAADIFKSLT